MGVKVRERPKGSGIYWIFIDHQGKRKSKKFGRDKRLAQEAAKKIEAKLVLGQLDLQPKDTSTVPKFSEYAEVWLKGYGKTALKYSTQESYRNELRNHITPYFGKKRLDEIARTDVKQFIYDSLGKDLAPATVRKQVAYLSSILNQAVDDEIIEHYSGTALENVRLLTGAHCAGREAMEITKIGIAPQDAARHQGCIRRELSPNVHTG